MGKIKKKDLLIGNTLYQYSSRILEYKIIAINELKTETHIEEFYIVECQSCSDHEKCKVAIKLNDYGNLEYSHMINGYEEDDEYKEEHGHYRNSHYYWHKNENYNFFLTRKEAQKFILNKNITYYEAEINKLQERIKDYEKSKIKAETDLEVLNESL